MTPTLTPTQARVIAALVEKSITTPQYHPMTVNALMLAANQKTCRSPVTSLSEGEVGGALADLAEMQFCSRDDSSGRVPKWRQRFSHQMLLKPPSLAVLVTLMLRGPQTASELRTNAAGVGGPADAEGLAAAIDDLADRAQPLVAQLPRAAGQKEARYAQLMCGPVESALPADGTVTVAPEAPVRAGLESRVAALEARLAELERQLGLAPPAP